MRTLETNNTGVLQVAARLDNVDILRGVAALSVTLFHLVRPELMSGALGLAQVARYGYLGVQVFFVISGFVIPLALFREGYTWAGLGCFFRKRFLRLYPAYLVSCLGIIGLWYLSASSPSFQGQAVSLTWAQVFGNVFMSCGVQGVPWINLVAWTLAIEVQYYLLMGLSFPLLCAERLSVRLVTVCVWIFMPLVGAPSAFVPEFGPVFACGLLVFVDSRKLLPRWLAAVLLLLALAMQCFAGNWGSAAVALFAVFCLRFLPTLRLPSLVWLGTISYSLYLVHVPLGGRVINLAQRLGPEAGLRWLAIPVALLVSLVGAWLLYQLVERPSHRWARRVVAKKSEARVRPV